jgi:hypothetical protein
VNAVIDAIESWLAAQSFWVQVPILLLIGIPICWLIAGVIDRGVELTLRRHTRREAIRHAQTDPGPTE